MDSSLGIFAFQYLGLGLVFVIGMLCAVRQGDVGLKDRPRRRNLVVMVGGLVFYLALHGFFQFVAVKL